MMRRLQLSILITVGNILLTLAYGLEKPVFAWGGRGHEIVALIAEQNLTDAVRQKVNAILAKNDTLARASTWHDRVGRRIPLWNPLHFVNVPRGATWYNKDRDCPTSNCIVEAIGWYSNVLRSSDAPLNEKRFALYFVVHLVGDLHQPLHVGYADDAGGSKVKVNYRGQEQSLHRLWDGGILDTEAGTAEEMAARLNGEFSNSEERRAWESGTPEQWANESLALTIEYVYPLPESLEISEEYAGRALPVLRKRLVQGGLRLARLLNETLK